MHKIYLNSTSHNQREKNHPVLEYLVPESYLAKQEEFEQWFGVLHLSSPLAGAGTLPHPLIPLVSLTQPDIALTVNMIYRL